MYISKVVSNFIYLRLFEVFNRSGNVRCGVHVVREISVGHFSGRESARRGCDWSGKFPLGICLVREISVGHLSGPGNFRRGPVWSGKSPSRMCLVEEVSVGDVSGRGVVRWGCVRESFGECHVCKLNIVLFPCLVCCNVLFFFQFCYFLQQNYGLGLGFKFGLSVDPVLYHLASQRLSLKTRQRLSF